MPELKRKVKQKSQKCTVITHVYQKDGNEYVIMVTPALLVDNKLTNISEISYLVPYIFPHCLRMVRSDDHRVCALGVVSGFKENFKILSGDGDHLIYDLVIDLSEEEQVQSIPKEQAEELKNLEVQTDKYW